MAKNQVAAAVTRVFTCSGVLQIKGKKREKIRRVPTENTFELIFYRGRIEARGVKWSSEDIAEEWEGIYTSDGSFTIRASPSSVLYIGRITSPQSLVGQRLIQGEERVITKENKGKEAKTKQDEEEAIFFEIQLDGVCIAKNMKRKIEKEIDTNAAVIWRELQQLIRELVFIERTNNVDRKKGEKDEVKIDFSYVLPPEVFSHILLFLPSAKEITHLSLVSLNFASLVRNDDWLWHTLYNKQFGPHTLLVDKKGRGPSTQKEKEKHNNVTWREWMEMTLKGDSKCRNDKMMKKGVFHLDGFTRNSSDHNVTRVHSIEITFFKNGTLRAIVVYRPGTKYNEGVHGTWTGTYDKETRMLTWDERLKNYPGKFIYQAEVTDHHTIKGTYRWDQNQAHGTCEYTLKL